MEAAFASGAIPFAIVAGMVIEALILAALFRRTGRGIPPLVLLPNLGAGACLMAAAGVALRGGGWGWVGGLLFAGGVLHAVDLRGRWR
jgi:hypothetical protein